MSSPALLRLRRRAVSITGPFAVLIAIACSAHAAPESMAVDRPVTWVDSAGVTVDEVWTRELGVDGQDAGSPVDPQVIHLVPADGGVAEMLVGLGLAPGTYDRVRLAVESGKVVLSSDAAVQDDHVFSTDEGDLKFPSGSQQGIQLTIDPPIRVVTRLSEELELDPDLSRSFVFNGSPTRPPGVKRVLFTPVVPTANNSTHGRITLRVVHSTAKCMIDDPLRGATVTAIDRSGSNPNVSTVTDNLGEAWIKLLPGSYDVVVKAGGYQPVTVANQEVYVANETAIGDVALDPVASATFDKDTALLLGLMSNIAYGDGRPCIPELDMLEEGEPLRLGQRCDQNDPPLQMQFADYLKGCWRFFRYIAVEDTSLGGTQLFLAWNTEDDDIVVAFAGTGDTFDKLADADATKVGWMLPDRIVPLAVHEGFRTEYSLVAHDLRVALDEAITAHVRDPSRSKVFFTGHSLGGALAGMAALAQSDRLVATYGYKRKNIVMYSFAAPRWLTTNLVGEFAARVPSGFALAGKDDVVPYVPPRGVPPEYTHIRQLRVLDSNITDRGATADGDRFKRIGATRVEISDGLPYTGCQGVVRAEGDPRDLSVGIPDDAYGKLGHDQWQYLKRVENITDGDHIPSIELRSARGPLGVMRVQMVWTGGVEGPCDWVGLYDSGSHPPENSQDYLVLDDGKAWAVFGEGYPLATSTHLTRRRADAHTDGLWIGYVDGFDRIIRTARYPSSPPGMARSASSTPGEVSLGSATPNPADHGIVLHYAIPTACPVRFTVHDVAGRLVRELDEGVRDAGEHTERWDLRDASGRAVRAGIYFVRFETGTRRLAQRVVVAR